MGRIKLKIKRLETTDSFLDTYAKRKSKMLIQEAFLREEEQQKARVKELEVRSKKLEAEWRNQAKDLKNQSYDLAIVTKNLEDKLSSYEKEEASLHTTSEDLETLHSDHDALRKAQAALLKKHVERRSLLDELLSIGDSLTFSERKKLAFNIDVERAKAKQLEQNRKEIEKGAYLAIKEALRKILASEADVEHAKVKQQKQNSKEIKKGASPTLKEGLRKKLDSDVDVECAKVKQLEPNRNEIVRNLVELGKDPFANDVGQNLTPISGLPMSMEEATPFDMAKNDKMTIRIGENIVPLSPKPTLLATVQAEKHAAKP